MSNVNFRFAQLKEANKRLKSEVALLEVENSRLSKDLKWTRFQYLLSTVTLAVVAAINYFYG